MHRLSLAISILKMSRIIDGAHLRKSKWEKILPTDLLKEYELLNGNISIKFQLYVTAPYINRVLSDTSEENKNLVKSLNASGVSLSVDGGSLITLSSSVETVSSSVHSGVNSCVESVSKFFSIPVIMGNLELRNQNSVTKYTSLK